MCLVSCVMCQKSGVTCQVSGVRCNFFKEVLMLPGGGSVINWAYPVYFLGSAMSFFMCLCVHSGCQVGMEYLTDLV